MKILSIILTVILSNLAIMGFSQGTTVYTGKENISLGLTVFAGQNALQNTLPDAYTYSEKSMVSPGGEIELNYSLSRFLGLGIGLGYQNFKSELTLDDYSSTLSSIDNEGDNFIMEISGNSISDKQSLGLLTIPVSVQLKVPVSSKLFLFVQPGICVSIPVLKKSSTTGTFTYNGYYPDYNVTLTDLPQYGFASNYQSTDENKLPTSRMILLSQTRAGITYSLNYKLSLSAGLSYLKSLSNVVENTEDELLTTSMDDLKSTSVLSTKGSLSGISGFINISWFIFR